MIDLDDEEEFYDTEDFDPEEYNQQAEALDYERLVQKNKEPAAKPRKGRKG